MKKSKKLQVTLEEKYSDRIKLKVAKYWKLFTAISIIATFISAYIIITPKISITNIKLKDPKLPHSILLTIQNEHDLVTLKNISVACDSIYSLVDTEDRESMRLVMPINVGGELPPRQQITLSLYVPSRFNISKSNYDDIDYEYYSKIIYMKVLVHINYRFLFFEFNESYLLMSQRDVEGDFVCHEISLK